MKGTTKIMKLSKTYITEKLQTMTVRELAEQITNELHVKYTEDGLIEGYASLGMHVDHEATIRKFESMIRPYAPVAPSYPVRENGVIVAEVV